MKILLFDGFSILNRAFYALPPLTTSSGEYTNAVYGFMSIFFRFIDEEKPDFVTVAFDLPQPTFRHNVYGAYKGTRKAMPDELRAQIPTLKTLLGKMGVHMAECPGFEADDVIGTLARKAVKQNLAPVIVTGDRDLLQLATDEVRIRLPKTKAGKTEVEDYYAADVLAKYGCSPAAYVDVKALMGDTSDNIPGVPGIGEVTATKIIAAYGSLDNALMHVDEIKPKKASENLAAFREQAIMSRELAAIVTDAPVELVLTKPSEFFSGEALAEVKRLELKTLYKRFETAEMTQKAKKSEFMYEVITDREKAAELFARLANGQGAAFCLILGAGIGIAEVGVPPVYVKTDEMGGGLTLDEFLALAKPWLECGAPKFVYDVKSETGKLRPFGINLRGARFDAHLAAYVLDALNPARGPEDIALYLNEEIPSLEDILDNKGRRGKDRRTVTDLPDEQAAGYAARVADAICRAKEKMEAALRENGQTELFQNIEMPLAVLLAEIEFTGIKVDKSKLAEFGEMLDGRIAALTALIHELAGEEFNINSPAQLGVVLFEKLGLKGGKKTTKGYSTAADVLEKLANKHPLVPLVLEYRGVTKLKSTYVDGLLPLVHPETSRIHSTFHQAIAATGRLSSAEPNLQNIPVRTALGRELRKAFVPGEGNVFIDADYSQIELRLLAHISGDPVLINAFRQNEDIHRITASQVLGISPEDVTAEERSKAKAVNFGIIYGSSAFGLSEGLKIPVKEAERYIQGYFEKYKGVKTYLDETIARAGKDGFVATLYNRRRAMPELKSSNFNLRSFGERVAMNMPIQGSAADIIKIAMLNVAARLKREGIETRIILQVHDELLLEAPRDETERVRHILKEEMEGAARLDVPLVADVKVGESWYDTK